VLCLAKHAIFIFVLLSLFFIFWHECESAWFGINQAMFSYFNHF
jgi:hypothetical protein